LFLHSCSPKHQTRLIYMFKRHAEIDAHCGQSSES
jgi:hypothetical protein